MLTLSFQFLHQTVKLYLPWFPSREGFALLIPLWRVRVQDQSLGESGWSYSSVPSGPPVQLGQWDPVGVGEPFVRVIATPFSEYERKCLVVSAINSNLHLYLTRSGVPGLRVNAMFKE